MRKPDLLNPDGNTPWDFISALIFGMAPNSEDYAAGIGPERRGTLFTFSIWLIIAPLTVWLLAYISGLFPYLGWYQYSRDGMLVSYIPSGPRTMILFKGQEAFINYEVDSKSGPNGEVTIDIRPWPALEASPAQHRVSGKTSGTVKVTIPETGVYRFHHGAGNLRESLTYSVTWGAK
jgi:hypothetical protein